jgi:hypothetical protein
MAFALPTSHATVKTSLGFLSSSAAETEREDKFKVKMKERLNTAEEIL